MVRAILLERINMTCSTCTNYRIRAELITLLSFVMLRRVVFNLKRFVHACTALDTNVPRVIVLNLHAFVLCTASDNIAVKKRAKTINCNSRSINNNENTLWCERDEYKKVHTSPP